MRRFFSITFAIIILATAFAAGAQAVYGNVDVADALLVGIPAVGGVLLGTWLQQRVPQDAIAFAFAILLVAAAIQLAVSS